MWEFLLAYLKYQLLKLRQRWKLKAWKFVPEFYYLNLGISTTFCIHIGYFYGIKIALDYWILIGEYVIDVININRTDVIIRWYRQISLT